MKMEDFNEFKTANRAQSIESAAYHEAGHLTAAALQDLPLLDRGVHIDDKGHGVSDYCHRVPGDKRNEECDIAEREKTILALYAGEVAQRRFFSDCSEDCWKHDRRVVSLLLDEMNLDEQTRTDKENTLKDKSRELVLRKHWLLVESLAKTLLAKPLTQQPPIEIECNWSKGQTNMERWMKGTEIVEFFRLHKVSCRLHET
jgi:hypothetical protein